MIIRRIHNHGYTIVANQIANDPNLSFDAVGLMTYLLSRPDNWNVHVNQLKGRGKCGRDKVRAILGDCIEAGYIKREHVRSEDGRQIVGVAYLVYDQPMADHPDQRQGPEKPSLDPQEPENQGPENQGPEKPSTEEIRIYNKTSQEPVEREREREGLEETPIANGDSTDDPKKFEVRVKRLADRLDWPGWANSSTAWTVARFAELTDAERADAEARAAAYVAHCGKKALSMGTYFQQRKWVDLPASVIAAAEAPPIVLASPFGKLWGALRLFWLLRPAGQLPRASAFLEKLMAGDDEGALRERLAHRSRHGWPAVNHLHRLAANGREIILPKDAPAMLEELAQAFVKVRVGSDEYLAWKALHEERGWPWLPDPGRQEWVYFPAGGPAGLEAFEQAVRGNHDAGGREAAE